MDLLVVLIIVQNYFGISTMLEQKADLFDRDVSFKIV